MKRIVNIEIGRFLPPSGDIMGIKGIYNTLFNEGGIDFIKEFFSLRSAMEK